MDRRRFIETLVGAGAGLALEKAIPFNRVWFFPQKIRLANYWRFGYLQVTFSQRWNVVHGIGYRPQDVARFDRERQIWIAQSVDPIEFKIIDAIHIATTSEDE